MHESRRSGRHRGWTWPGCECAWLQYGVQGRVRAYPADADGLVASTAVKVRKGKLEGRGGCQPDPG